MKLPNSQKKTQTSSKIETCENEKIDMHPNFLVHTNRVQVVVNGDVVVMQRIRDRKGRDQG